MFWSRNLSLTFYLMLYIFSHALNFSRKQVFKSEEGSKKNKEVKMYRLYGRFSNHLDRVIVLSILTTDKDHM